METPASAARVSKLGRLLIERHGALYRVAIVVDGKPAAQMTIPKLMFEEFLDLGAAVLVGCAQCAQVSFAVVEKGIWSPQDLN